MKSKKKSVGIITYYWNHNYGTMLQALALQRIIEEQNFYSEIIDFKNENRPSKVELLCIRIKRLPIYLKEYIKYKRLYMAKKKFAFRDAEFDKFYLKYIKVGDCCYLTNQQLKDNPPVYDAYIVGSDQTWNPCIYKKIDAFHLGFAPHGAFCGSYAPSIAISNFSLEQKQLFNQLIKRIQFLSCREETGSQLIKEITGRVSTTVVDPTLLLSSSEWCEYEEAYQIDSDSKYILQYFLGDVKEHREFVKKLSDITGYRIISLPFSYLDVDAQGCQHEFVGPGKFLYLIHNAQYICTDSFHGTVFSINYRKQFFSFCKYIDTNKESENSRLYDLLKGFSLEDRLITSEKMDWNSTVNQKIDYSAIDEIIQGRIDESKKYLFEMLKNVR